MKYLVFFLSIFCNMIYAQDILQDTSNTDVILPDITITSTKEKKNLNDTPLPISIIDSKEIKSTGSNRLDDIINNQTGIITVPTLTGTEGVQVQGLDASYTTILIDGCPLIGRSFGTLDLQRISVLNIDRIEFLRGSSSSLYGSDALAGVINIITEEQTVDGKNISISMKHSSYNTFNPNIIYKYKKLNFQSMYSFDYYKTDGYDLISTDILNTVNPFSNYTFYSKHKYDINEKFSFRTSIRYYNQDQLKTSIVSDTLLEGETKLNEWNLFSSFKYDLSSSVKQYLDFYATNYRSDEFLKTQDNQLFDDNYFDHILLKPELRTYIDINKINLITGIGSSRDILDRKHFMNSYAQDLIFAYTQLDGKLGLVDFIIGSRYDNYLNIESNLSHKIALGMPVSKKIKFNGSLGTGFKVPDFRQRFFDFTNSEIGYTVLGRDVAFDRLTAMKNQGMLLNEIIPFSELSSFLSSEKSLNINIGIVYLVSKYFNLDLNMFNNKINDLIETQLVANKINSSPIFSYFNLNQVVTSGLKFGIEFDNNIFGVKYGYQFLSAFDPEIQDLFDRGEVYARDSETLLSFQLSPNDYVGLFNRSKHMMNFKSFYNYKDIARIDFSLLYRSKYALKDINDNQVLDIYDDFIDRYFISDLALSHKINQNINMQVGVNNLFDYSNPEYISNISGRIYFISAEIKIL